MATALAEREMAARGEGCLGKAKDDEPVFVLRGQDRLMPTLVALWTELAEAHGAVAKVTEARQLLEYIRSWQYENGCKWPD
jgi:hypothetical protein